MTIRRANFQKLVLGRPSTAEYAADVKLGSLQKWIFLALSITCLGVGAARADCACGPDFCQNDARISATLAAKKQSLGAAGYPSRLTSLLDVGQQCYARITRAPDIFTMLIVDPNGNSQTVPWSTDDETIANNHLLNGSINRYWIFNARRAFSCCNQPNYDAQSDYDSTDDVNTLTAIKCTKSGTQVSCTR